MLFPSKKIFSSLFLLSSFALASSAIAQAPASATPTPAPPKYPDYPSEIPAKFTPTYDGFDYVRREVDDPDARRREAPHRHPRPEAAREGRADPPDAHALRRDALTSARRERAPRRRCSTATTTPSRRDRRGRLHPRRPGRPRQVRLRGRLRHEPAAARAAEPDARRPRDRHLGHDRLAGEERAGDERQGRHPRDLVQRLPAADGARRTRTRRSRSRCR